MADFSAQLICWPDWLPAGRPGVVADRGCYDTLEEAEADAKRVVRANPGTKVIIYEWTHHAPKYVCAWTAEKADEAGA